MSIHCIGANCELSSVLGSYTVDFECVCVLSPPVQVLLLHEAAEDDAANTALRGMPGYEQQNAHLLSAIGLPPGHFLTGEQVAVLTTTLLCCYETCWSKAFLEIDAALHPHCPEGITPAGL